MMVLQFGIDPGYVLDEMKFYEMEALIRNSYLRNKDSWEQARLIGGITAQVNSSKPIDIHEIIKFPWDKGEEAHVDTPEDIERMMNEMKNIENQLNNGK